MPPKLFLDIASPRRGSSVGVAVETGARIEQSGVTVRCWLDAPAKVICAADAPERTEQDVVRRRPSASQTMGRSSCSAARSCIASRQRAWSATPAPAAGSPRVSSTHTRRAAKSGVPCSGLLPAVQSLLNTHGCSRNTLLSACACAADIGAGCPNPARSGPRRQQRGAARLF